MSHIPSYRGDATPSSSVKRVARASSLGVSIGFRLVVGLVVTALLATLIAIGVESDRANASPYGDDGLVVTVTPERIKPNSSDSFTLQVKDLNLSGATFDYYTLWGVPRDWVVRVGSWALSPISPEPLLYRIAVRDAIGGQIQITPPPGFVGTLSGVTLGRLMDSPNQITDFDHGTFDYLGEAKPRLPYGATQYGYHDPTVAYTTPACNSAQYGPCDGDYTIWPTANFNGRASHYNNYWADLRSTTNPMEWPKTEEICRDWWNSTPGGMALNQTMVTEAESRYSGKIAVFNGAVDMPVPNDFLATTVTGLEAHRAYAFGAHVANISDDPSGGTKAVRTAAYVKTSLADVGTIIGSTRDLPKQPSCFNDMTEWSQISSVVMTGDATQLILSLRNYGAGGFGNDVAIDGLTLFPMAQASVDLKVVSANPALTVSKVASPESTVRPGDLVMYTVTATNSGDVRLDPVRVVDDLSGVLDNATFVVGSEKAVIGGVPRGAVSLVGTTLTWTGVLDVAETVTLTYSARVNMDLGPKDRLVNHVIGTGTYPEEPGMDVPSTCRTGEEPMCSVTLDPRVPGLYVVKVSDPVSGSLVRPGAPVTYTVTATNVGTVDLDPVAVTDDLTGVLAHARVVKGSVAASIGGQAVTAPTITGTTLTWSGILPVGKTVTLTYRVEVNADVAPGDRLVNVVVGTGTDPGEPNTEVPSTCVTGEEPGCSSELIPAVPKLVVEKTADPASGATVRPGDVVTYHVAATNVGTVPLDPTWITDDLSGVLAHAQMVDGSLSASVGGVMVSPPKVSGTTLTWSGALGAGETVMVSYQVRVNADVKPGDDLVNHVVAKGTDPGDPNTEVPGTCVTGEDPECTTDHPVGVPKLVVAKVADPVSGSVVRPGDTVSYTVTATNVGTVGFDPVVVTDDLAGVLAHARIQDGSLSAHVAGAPVHPPTVDGTTLTWSGALPTGASVVLGYQVVVNADVSPGDELVNHVVAKGTDPGDPNTEVPGTCVTGEDPACTTTHPAGVPKLVIEKVSDPVSGSHVRPGGTVTYAVTATNAGTVDFDPVRVTDDLSGVLAHAQMVEGSLSAQVGGKVVAAPMVSGTTLTWSGPLRVGEAVTLSYQVVVNADVAPGDALVNHVVGKGTDPEIPGTEVPGECVTGVGPECTTAHPAGVPKMVVEKVSDPASGSLVRPGDTLAYTVIATNVGTVDFDPVTVTDDLSGVLAHARMVDGSMSAQVGGVIVGPPQVKGTTLTWSGALAAGSSVTLAYAVQVNADVSPGDLLVNHVLGTGVDPGDPGDPGTEVPGTCVTGVDPECTTTHPAGVPKLVMEKVSDPVSGSRVRPGDTVTYTVTATNTGSVDFAPVIVADDLSGVLAHARMVDGSVSAHVGGVGVDDPLLIGTTLIWSGPLPVGRSVTMSYQVVVNEDVAPGDVLVNHVVSKGTDPEVPGTEVPGTCVTGQAAECTTDHPVGVPKLVVEKTADPVSGSLVRPGDTVKYAVTATNVGTVELDPVTVTDDLSGVLAHAQIVDGSLSASADGVSVHAPSVSGTTLTWKGVLSVGQSVTVSYRVVVNADVTPGDRLVNHVVGKGTDPDEPETEVPGTCVTGKDPECTTDHPVGVPQLVLEKTADPVSGSQVHAGDTVTYTVTATNVGTTDLDPVTVTDDLSGVLAHAQMVVGSLSAQVVDGSSSAQVGGVPVHAPLLSDTTLTWTGVLSVGQSVTLSYRVVVNTDVTPGDRLVNHVIGKGTDPDEPETEVPGTCVTGKDPECTTDHPVGVPKLVVEKTADPVSGSQVHAGDTVTYTVTATNVGTTDLDPVTVTDDLSGVLAHAQMVDGSLSAQVVDGSVSAPAGGVPVHAPLLSDTTLTWKGVLSVGQSVTVSYRVVVNSDVTPGDRLVNHVVGKGTDPDEPETEVPGTCVTGKDPECTTDHPVGVPKLVVEKTADPVSGSQVHPGDTVTYAVTATNVGTTDLDPVTVTDDLSGVLAHAQIVDGSLSASADGVPVHAPSVSGTTLTWKGVLSVGQSVTVSYRVVVNTDVTPGDRLVNHVIGKGTDPDEPETEVPGTCVTGKDPECTTDHPVGVPQLVLEKTSDPVSGSQVRPGDTVTYTVIATNTGTVDLDPVTVTDDLSGVLAHAQMVGGSVLAQVAGKVVAVPQVSGTTLTWTGVLSVGQSVTLSYQVVVKSDVTPGDRLVNHVVGKGTDPDEPETEVPGTCVTGKDPECTTDHPVGVPKLVLEKTADPVSGTQVHAGDTVTYAVTATNVGTTDLDPVTVTDELSGVLAHAQIVDGSLSASADGVPVHAPSVSDTTLTWAGVLSVGQSVTLSYQVVVNSDVTPGDRLVNHVVGKGTDPDEPETEVPGTCVTGKDPECTTDHPVGVPKLVLEKTADPVSGSQVHAGDTVTYTVTATNVGTTDLDPVTVTDDLSGVLAHAQMVDGSMSAQVVDGSVSASAGGVSVPDPSVSDATLTWRGVLSVGQSVTLSYQVVVNSDVTPGDRLVNHVVGKGTDPDEPETEVPGTCVTGKDPECTTDHPVGVPQLVLEKTADPVSGSQVHPGDTVTYAVTATNTGTVDLDPVTVSDDLSGVLAHAQIVDGSLSARMGDGSGSAPAGSVPVHAPSVSDTTLTWKGVLSVGQSVTLSYRVVVNSDVTPGDRLVNHVIGKGTDPDEPETEVPGTCVTGKDPECTTDHPVGVPKLVVEKTADPVSGSQVHAGDTVTYTVTATNVGTTDLDPVTVTDDLSGVLAHAQIVDGSLSAQVVDGSGSAPAGGVPVHVPSVSGTTLTWKGVLPVGQSVTVSYRVVVNADVTPGDRLVNHVVGKGTDPDEPETEVPGTCVTGKDPECTTDHPVGVPQLVLEKTADPVSGSQVHAGDTVTYTVTATNVGTTDLDPVTVTDDLSGVLAHAQMVVGSLSAQVVDGSSSAQVGGVPVHAPLLSGTTLTWTGVLSVGQSVTLSYQVVVNSDVTPGDRLVNHVVGKGTDPDEPETEVPGTCVTGKDPECTTDHPVGVPKLVVEKTADPVSGSQVHAGDTVTYAVTATNVGTTDLDPVTVTDDLSGVLAHAQMVVGSLSAQVVDGSSSAPAGGVPVHAPSVSDTTLTWTGVLSVGQSVTVSYRVVVNSDVTPGDRLVNHVVGKGTDPDEPETEVPGTCVTGKDPECTTDHPVGVPKLVLEKTADPASGSTVRPGDTVTYSVTATNVGTVDLDPVTVTDDLSGVLAHAQMVDGSLSARMVDGSLSAPVVDGSRPAPVVDGSTPTPVVDSSTPTQVVDGSRPTQVNGAHVADPLLSGTTLTWTGALSPGQSVTVSYQVVVSDTARPGDALVNHVVGTGTDPDDPDTDVPSTCVTGHEPACTTTHPAGVPKLVIEKLADADSQQGVHPGQIVTYTVTASNQGTVDLDPATVVDDLSLVVAHARLVDDSVSASVMGVPVAPPRVADHLVTWSGPLAVGETLTLTYQVQVDLDIRPGDLLVNRVHGTGTDPEDPDTDVPATCVDGEEEGCSVTLVPRVPRLHVVKESDPPSGATVRPGQRVTYTVTTTNVGQVRLDPVSVVDNLSGVLPLARFEDGSQTAVLDGVPTAAPVLLGSSLTWMGPMGPGSVLRMTYQVVVDEDLDARASLLNRVIAQGVDPDSRGDDVPSTCVAGDEDGCWTTHTPDLPRLVVHKASNPPSGSTVSPGDVISYTVTASNAGNRHLDPVRLVDDMSAVVSHADLAYASLSASIDGREVDPPVWTGTTLTWSGPLAVGATVTLTYQAVVVAGDGGTLWNLVQGTGHDPDDPGSEVPSTCVTGLEEGCSVTVTVPPPPSPPHGIIVATGGTAHTSATWTALASALVLAGAGAWGMVRARGRKQE